MSDPIGAAYETGELRLDLVTDEDEGTSPEDAAETIEALVALGVGEPAAREAVANGTVPLVLIQDILGEERPYTLSEIAERGGISVEALRRVFLALGMPLPDRFGEADLEEARQLAELTEIFSVDALVRLARVRGMSVSRIAMSDLDAVRMELLAPMRDEDADDLTIAVTLAESAKALIPVATDLLDHAYRRSLFHAMSTEVVTAATRSAGQELDLVIGFVDLVGYTALSARIDPSGLDHVLDVFERRVLDVTSRSDQITLVKFLGDAAMFVSTDATPLAAALLDVVDPVEELEESPMRAGMARGPTLVREGDYYGTGVNLAARITDRARPWTLLADEDLDDELSGRFATSRIRPMRLHGVGMRRPLSVMKTRTSGA